MVRREGDTAYPFIYKKCWETCLINAFGYDGVAMEMSTEYHEKEPKCLALPWQPPTNATWKPSLDATRLQRHAEPSGSVPRRAEKTLILRAHLAGTPRGWWHGGGCVRPSSSWRRLGQSEGLLPTLHSKGSREQRGRMLFCSLIYIPLCAQKDLRCLKKIQLQQYKRQNQGWEKMSVEKNNKAKAKVKTLICSLKTTSFTRLPNSLNKEGNKE